MTAPSGTGEPADPSVDRLVAQTSTIGDRSISPIGGRSGGTRGRWITLAALAAGCGAFLVATWDRGDRRPPPRADEPARQFVSFEPARRPADPPRLSEADVDPNAPTLTRQSASLEEPIVPAIEGAASSQASPRGPTAEDQRRTLADSARRAPVLPFSRTGGGGAPQPVLLSDLAGPSPPSGEANAFERLRQSRAVTASQASRLPDRRFLITAGSSLPCLLQTAMESATPGFVTCLIPRDIYSDDGTVVLLARGTRVLGEYSSGLQRGRGRLFVLWTRAVTPDGVAIALASPAADDLGRAGFDGRIESHFWERFGGALVLSLVDGATYAAVDAGSQRGVVRAPSDAATVALSETVGIPPTLRKDQGSEVSIFVAQDLDFSTVYQVRPR